ncbi:TSUP family transporter [Haloglycomyces albus]|uniref:TSUP family transporter n=1 Tax=Haloglycomyces albus TaxID=526067 RepID=UPI00046D6B41|nr:TSUP family transporter [Haloglycomyces albus]
MDVDAVFGLLILAAVAAGWVDAVVGGGGLLQLPALMVAYPQAPVATLLGTNKLGSVAGTTTAAVTYGRKVKLNHRLLWPTVGTALAGSGLGAALAGVVSSNVLRPIIIGVLGIVAVFILARPTFGLNTTPVLLTTQRAVGLVVTAGLVIAFYDGILGPGTGIFLALAFTGILGYDYVTSAAHVKVVNAATNIGALLVFGFLGHVWWLLGLALMGGNAFGAYLGARTALRRGTSFVRIMLLIVVSVLMVRLSYDVLRQG